MSNTICQLLDSERAQLAEAVTTRQYQAQPEMAAKYGEAGRNKCLQDANYHLSYLTDAVSASSPALFSDYVAWAKVMLSARGVPATDLSRNLVIMQEVLRQKFPAESSTVIDQFFEAALKRLPSISNELPTLLEGAGPHIVLARRFLELLLNGEREAASQLILQAVDSGVSVRDVYLHVFQSSQREIGRLWQLNQVSVAQEHYCTAATQLIMAQLYPRIFRSEKSGRRIIVTSAGGELHEIGARIVADFFEMEGWDTYYLGANSPFEAVLQALSERGARLLAVSATMVFHIRVVGELIARVRASSGLNTVKILVGGYPFNIEPELWQRVGADAFAIDAGEAVAVARALGP